MLTLEQALTIATTALREGAKILPVPGGVLIRNAAGEIVGSVGVTGDTSDHDEICSMAGIEAAGLTADNGARPG
jgi:uncharacterized protein GlcG (DUF336 family)